MADIRGAPGYWGYSGPSPEEFANVDVETVVWIRDLRKTTSAVEIELLQESAKWGKISPIRDSWEQVEPGRHELRIAKRAGLVVTLVSQAPIAVNGGDDRR